MLPMLIYIFFIIQEKITEKLEIKLNELLLNCLFGSADPIIKFTATSTIYLHLHL